MSYENMFRVRSKRDAIKRVDDVQDWLWVAEDSGAWDGPKNDWEYAHYQNIMIYVKNFDVVVQAGGNQGMYPRLLSELFKRVYTFEPDPLNFHCLVNNCQKDNIVKFQAALGDRHAMISVLRGQGVNGDMGNTGAWSVKVNEEGLIPQMMIDDLALTKCDFIWLDVEGYENPALLGAAETISKFKPVIFAERGDDEVSLFLHGFGYERKGTSSQDAIYVVP
jgi:FkbM family methyltransferase